MPQPKSWTPPKPCEATPPGKALCPNDAAWLLRGVLGQPRVCGSCFDRLKLLYPEWTKDAVCLHHIKV